MRTGSGTIEFCGGKGHGDDTVVLHYYKPKNFSPESDVLLVIPGSGRNGDEYRGAWIEASEKHSLLILSPEYKKDDYDFGQYHMGGLMYDMRMEANITRVPNSNEVFLDEENFSFKVNADKDEWLFNDFDISSC